MQESILIVEDHPIVRDLLRAWLEMIFPQCLLLEATNRREAIEQAVDVSPQLVLMDLDVSFLNGIEAAQQIKALAPETAIVVLTIHEEDPYHADALAAGASAYIPKCKMHTDLIPILSGLLNVPPGV